MKSPQSSRKIGFLVSLLAATTWALALSAQAGYAPFPYATDFESGLLNTNYWTLQGTWGLSTEAAKSGTNALTDSPQGVYAANDDSAAILGVNLRRAVRPRAEFLAKPRPGTKPRLRLGRALVRPRGELDPLG